MTKILWVSPNMLSRAKISFRINVRVLTITVCGCHKNYQLGMEKGSFLNFIMVADRRSAELRCCLVHKMSKKV